MVVTDIQVCFALGALCADLAAPAIIASKRASPLAESALYARLRHRVLLYPALVLGPSATLFMLSWPGWETQYLGHAFAATASAPWHALLFALFLALLGLGAWLGNWLGFKWVLAGERRRLRVVCGAILVATVALVLARWSALIHLGSYADFARGHETLPHVWEDPTFLVWFCALTAYCGLPLLLLGWRAYREPAGNP